MGGAGKIVSFVVVVPVQVTVLDFGSRKQSAAAFCGLTATIRANAPLVTAIPADTFDRRGLVRVRLKSFVVIRPRL